MVDWKIDLQHAWASVGWNIYDKGDKYDPVGAVKPKTYYEAVRETVYWNGHRYVQRPEVGKELN